jgi:hypothetical protein
MTGVGRPVPWTLGQRFREELALHFFRSVVLLLRDSGVDLSQHWVARAGLRASK